LAWGATGFSGGMGGERIRKKLQTSMGKERFCSVGEGESIKRTMSFEAGKAVGHGDRNVIQKTSFGSRGAESLSGKRAL